MFLGNDLVAITRNFFKKKSIEMTGEVPRGRISTTAAVDRFQLKCPLLAFLAGASQMPPLLSATMNKPLLHATEAFAKTHRP